MRVLFAGTPEVALPTFQALLGSDHEVCAAITRPDARRGRGRKLTQSPVAQLATTHDIPVLKPATLHEPEIQQAIQNYHADVAVVVAYGNLIPPELLDVPTHGWINLHFSLLPAWRGAAPVQHAVMAGEDITGASTFRIEEGLDTGPVFGTVTERIRPRDTAGDLLERLADSGAHLVLATVDALSEGSAEPIPQSNDGLSYAPRLHPADARIDWEQPAAVIDRRIRGTTPNPGAWTITPEGTRLKVAPVDPAPEAAAFASEGLAPGEVMVTKDAVLVGSGSTPVALGEVAPAGRSWMPAADWARGARLAAGDRLGGEAS